MQIGFEAVDLLAQEYGLAWNKKLENKSQIARGTIRGSNVVLCKPMAYMNLSGDSVSPISKYYKVPLNKVCLHDKSTLRQFTPV